MNTEKLSYLKCNEILTEIGNRLDKPSTILAVGGYCMLMLGVRESTIDIDFIPSSEEFLVPQEHRDVVNSDVLNIAEMNLNFEELEPYAGSSVQFGNLKVMLAGIDMLFAMKLIASRNRTQQRDKRDLLALYTKVDLRIAYEVYSLIHNIVESYEDWCADVETDIYLASIDVDLSAKRASVF